MRSPFRCVAVNLSAHDQTGIERLLSENVRLLRSSFKKVGVGPTVRDPVGGIPTISRRVDLTAEGTRRRVVLSIGKGRKHAYITEVVVGNVACREDLAVAQLMLSTLEYSK